MEVKVVPGPNTRSPVFQQSVYEVQVSEGVAINTTVATITVSTLSTTNTQHPRGPWTITTNPLLVTLSTPQAKDPEDDPVSYSIVSGNDLRQFAIGDKTGVITIIRKLDREDLTRYQLVIWTTSARGCRGYRKVTFDSHHVKMPSHSFD